MLFRHHRSLRSFWTRCGLTVLVFCAMPSIAFTADILLRNSMILRGKLLVMNSMADRPVGKEALGAVVDADPTAHLIALMDTGWQRIYFPVQQEDKKKKIAITALKPVTVPIPVKKQAKSRSVTSFGAMMGADPFDEWGRRRVKIAVGSGAAPMDVFQAINEITPDHVMIESLNIDWKLGLALKSIPSEVIEQMLRRHVKQDDVVGRFSVVRLYIQAQYFTLAYKELEAIGKDFAEQKELVESTKIELTNYFGAEILRNLERRRKSGQHQLAETYAKELVRQPLTGPVHQNVTLYLREYDQSRQSIDRVNLLLGELQEKLNDVEKEKLVQPLRSEIREQLDFETLPRMDAFLKAEGDDQYEPAQRLGLAYSAWVLGPADAIPDLDQALRLWDARNLTLEYLRSDDPSLDVDLLKKLESTENISPAKVLKLTAQLPPIIDSSDMKPGTAHLVELQTDKPVSYWVTLPAEYSSHHNYPMVIALRPRPRTAEEAAAAWAGDLNDADLGINRGYIVIAPEYADKNAAEYSFGSPTHKCVLDCLFDARKRFSVDSNRVYLAGHGMGGDAAFDIGMAHPDEFAGVLALGGSAVNYCIYTADNASYTAWYAIGKGFDSAGVRDTTSNVAFDKMMRSGFKTDFMLVEYLGRNGETMIDEIPKLYDWMDLHQRPALPKNIKVSALRKSDDRYFWLTAKGLPKDYILPAPSGGDQHIRAMEIDAKSTDGNAILISKSPTENYTFRLSPELIDFDKKVIVRINGKLIFNNFIKPETSVVLEELRQRGDRNRLPQAVINR